MATLPASKLVRRLSFPWPSLPQLKLEDFQFSSPISRP
jgi:hypothetical protein